MASFTKEVNPRLAKRPLVFNGRLANRGLTSLIKEVNGNQLDLLGKRPVLLLYPAWLVH